MTLLRAAALVLVALGIGAVIGYEMGALLDSADGVANPQILDLVPEGSERSLPGEEVALDRSGVATLVLNTRLAEAGGTYEARVVGADGTVATTVSGLVPSEYGNLRLLLPGGLLDAGRYTVEVVDEASGRAVERFPLTVGAGAGSGR